MHYLKCSINITHTILGAAEDPWHLASIFRCTINIYNSGNCILQICVCVVYSETRHHTQANVTFGAFICRALSHTMSRTKAAAK